MRCVCVFFFKQRTADEMRISDWSSDVCASDLGKLAGITGRKCSKPARQAIDGLAPTNVACPDRLAREKPTIEPDTKVRPLLEREIGRAGCRERVCQYV